jgi:hypothetical protein
MHTEQPEARGGFVLILVPILIGVQKVLRAANCFYTIRAPFFEGFNGRSLIFESLESTTEIMEILI